MSGNRTDIDINDPDFWKKWAKKADVDVEGLKHKVQYDSVSLYIQTLFYMYKCNAPILNICCP